MNGNEIYEERLKVAHFKFALIAPVIQGIFPDASKAAYYKRICENPIKTPQGKLISLRPKTVAHWERLYNIGGMDALVKGERKDMGQTRVLSNECISEIYRLKEQYPKLNATQIYQSLIMSGHVTSHTSVRSVQRFVKEWNLKRPSTVTGKDRLAFEEEYFGAMWQSDSCHFPFISENGKKKKTYLIMIIDDCSRLIVGAEIFYEDNSYNFQRVLKRAIATYGIPHKVYVDHGSPYWNNQISFITDSVGTLLLHAPVRDGSAKGKIERAFRTVKERWLYGLEVSKIDSLTTFNDELTKFIREYNLTNHSGIGTTPMKRFCEANGRIPAPQSKEWLDEAFMNRISRKVKTDATVSIDKVYYDAPMRFVGQTVEIRFLPNQMEKAYIYHDKEHFPIRRTDKVANGKTRRINSIAIDYTKIGGTSDV